MIIDLEVVLRKFFSLIDLFRAQTLCVHKSSEFVIVGKFKNFVLKPFKVVLTSFKSLNNS